jgi:hypothetical protein
MQKHALLSQDTTTSRRLKKEEAKNYMARRAFQVNFDFRAS